MTGVTFLMDSKTGIQFMALAYSFSLVFSVFYY